MSEIDRQLSIVADLLPELIEIDAILNDFNIFSLLGSFHLELAHTRILEFVFNPRAQHGFGDAFFREFLSMLPRRHPDRLGSIQWSRAENDDSSGYTIERESRSIDLLVIDKSQRIALLIENKIHSTEHGKQLTRYSEIVNSQFSDPSWTVIPIYITLNGDLPSNPSYFPVSYRSVAAIFERLLLDSTLPNESAVRITLAQYVAFLRRSFVGEYELAARAKQFYDQAPDAFELILKHRDFPRPELQRFLAEVVTHSSEFILDEVGTAPGKRIVLHFSHERIERHQALELLGRRGPWTHSGRTLLFQFDIAPQDLKLVLYVGPGPESLRKKLISVAALAGPPFDTRFPEEGKNKGADVWRPIYQRDFLSVVDYFDMDLARLEELVSQRWEMFIQEDLEIVLAAFDAREFIGSLEK
ncbi:MAG: PD-(D/E)XK nuclease family protein [Thermomicrobiales bacterium]